METGSKQHVIDIVSKAIQQGKDSVEVGVLTDGVIVTHIIQSLPAPQGSGTYTQKISYANSRARKIVELTFKNLR